MLQRFVLLVALLFTTPAIAADPTGSWRLDSDGFQEQIMAMIEPQLAELPEAMRAQMGQMMMGMFAEMQSRMSGVAVFAADGSIEFNADNGERHTGRWESQGENTIVIAPDDPNAEPISATLQGDRMVSVLEGEEMPAPIEMVWLRQ